MGSDYKRKRSRVHFETSISLFLDDQIKTYQRTYDVSMNGVFVKTATAVELGTACKFHLTLSVGMRKEIIKGECEVVRIVSMDDGLSEELPGPGMALKFIELEPESSELLFQIIRHNEPQE